MNPSGEAAMVWHSNSHPDSLSKFQVAVAIPSLYFDGPTSGAERASGVLAGTNASEDLS